LKVPDLASSLGLPYRIRKILGQRGQLSSVELSEITEVNDETVGRTLRRMSDLNKSGKGVKGDPYLWSLRSA